MATVVASRRNRVTTLIFCSLSKQNLIIGEARSLITLRDSLWLLYSEQLHFKQESRVRRDARTKAVRAVTKFRRDDQPSFTADLHRHNALVPASDDGSRSDFECVRLTLVNRTVELGSIRERSCVMHRNALPGFRAHSRAFHLIDVLQTGCSRHRAFCVRNWTNHGCR